ncbi:Os02g0227800 [Oryza sativa Japonica Group]|uniref:Os02g0227800 protein n=1 Tax=Oryza sativa subsp. japonica TaxID=39947 RepID=A0A0P0VGT1_ORYSJ|nr:Os02g0227800 [Oryza sativa Japonica Group]
MLYHHSTSADMWDHCTGAPSSQPSCTQDRATPPAAPYRTVVASFTAGRTSSCCAGLHHRTRLSRQFGLPPSVTPLAPSGPPRRRPRLLRLTGLHCHRLRLSAPSWPPTPPIATTPARCGRLPHPRLAVRDCHASSNRRYGHHHRSRCCQRTPRRRLAVAPSPPSSRDRRHELRAAITTVSAPRCHSRRQPPFPSTSHRAVAAVQPLPPPSPQAPRRCHRHRHHEVCAVATDTVAAAPPRRYRCNLALHQIRPQGAGSAFGVTESCPLSPSSPPSSSPPPTDPLSSPSSPPPSYSTATTANRRRLITLPCRRLCPCKIRLRRPGSGRPSPSRTVPHRWRVRETKPCRRRPCGRSGGGEAEEERGGADDGGGFCLPYRP